ncbi:MAG: DUF2252 domain-containing protein [Cyanobacteria bacterium TGS_CYA1]|nr:DUF2252 domain-containing protein [Cyanobacteria bacterium TGS_CYA1]
MKKKPQKVINTKQIHSSAIHADYLEKCAHLRTRKDRFEVGRAMREKCPREEHSQYQVDWKKRRDPIELLIESSQGRIESLLPIRYGRMSTSPFAFFRGSAVIMAADLVQTPDTGYAVQCCGDSHLCNFGAFATPERNVIFDINDFDETFPAPWEWDLKRLAASFVIASKHNGHKKSECRAAAIRMVECYRERMLALAQMPSLSAWYDFLCYEELIDRSRDRKFQEQRRKDLKKAMARDGLTEFVKLGHIVNGKPGIKDQPPLIYHDERYHTPEFQKAIMAGIEDYRLSLPMERRVLFDHYEYVDTAIKVVGVGSVGTMCLIVLFFAAENDPLFLQVKEARKSVLEPYSGYPPFQSHGERVVFGQRLMQAASDVFLGHFIGLLQNKHYYVRQLRDVKVKIPVETFSAQEMLIYAQKCGWALARAHARSGDPAILSGYIGKAKVLPEAVANFAETYSIQNERDYNRLLDAIKSGALQTQPG